MPVFMIVGATVAQQVRRDDPGGGFDEHGEHLAVEVAPARFAVEAEEDLLRLRIAFVQVVTAQALVAVEVVDVVGAERVVGQVRESILWGSECLGHRADPGWRGVV